MRESNTTTKTVKAGISFGCCLAIVISYTAWGSFWWAVLHGMLSWVYIIYYAIAHGFN